MAVDNQMTLQAAYLSGGRQLESRPVVENELNVQVDASFKYVSLLRSGVETSSRRPLHDNLASRVQFDVWDPLTCGLNVLAQTDWASKNNYVNPPFTLIPKVLDIIQSQGATATLIAPKWEGQLWYQRLINMLIDQPIPSQ